MHSDDIGDDTAFDAYIREQQLATCERECDQLRTLLRGLVSEYEAQVAETLAVLRNGVALMPDGMLGRWVGVRALQEMPQPALAAAKVALQRASTAQLRVGTETILRDQAAALFRFMDLAGDPGAELRHVHAAAMELLAAFGRETHPFRG